MTFNEGWDGGADGPALGGGGGGGGQVNDYWQPLIADAVDTGGPDSIIVSWDQDPVTLMHTVVIATGKNTGSWNPALGGFRLMPLKDTAGVVIPALALGSFNSYLNIVSGMTDGDDETAIQVGLVNADTMAVGDAVWQTLHATTAGKPRLIRVGRNATIGGSPSAWNCINARQEILTQISPTSGALRIIETIAYGADINYDRINGAAAGLSGLTMDVVAAPHLVIAANAFGTSAELTVEFFIDIEARALPGGAFPR